MNTRTRSNSLAIMALMTALIFVLQFVTVPLGAITVSLAMVPVSVTAVALGPAGGLAAGAIWGLASLLKALLGSSGMTSILFNMSPLATALLCFFPRILDGVLVGLLYRGFRKLTNPLISGSLVGFLSAFFNTLFFMSGIVLLFGQTAYLQKMMAGRNVLAFILSIIAGNALFEMLVAAVVTGPVVATLSKAHLIKGKNEEM
ncbi:ECF transporter S component [Shuttleworthella satelles]|nr:ECF transporter S component [Shuttleworthia satelles]